ncbi:hypothetical protein [Streptomyces sp. LN549]|uniref:hypothetical protein n=1 Tax=Streptomyces sp. LN549 TaxID=3112979 RepID=UPI00371385C6
MRYRTPGRAGIKAGPCRLGATLAPVTGIGTLGMACPAALTVTARRRRPAVSHGMA